MRTFLSKALDNYTQLSDSMTKWKARDVTLLDIVEKGTPLVRVAFNYDTPSVALTSGTAAIGIPLCVVPFGYKVVGGVVRFEAMGTDADLDLGLVGLNGNGRYDDTIGSAISAETLVTGQYYEILNSGGDFSNVGASSNAVGTVFKATGTSPTTWTGVTVRQIGVADDVDFFLDGIDVAAAGVDTFADLYAGDSNYNYELKKDCLLVATALTADWAASKNLKGYVELTRNT